MGDVVTAQYDSESVPVLFESFLLLVQELVELPEEGLRRAQCALISDGRYGRAR